MTAGRPLMTGLARQDRRRRVLAGLGGLAAAALVPVAAQANSAWPSRPLRIVVPYAPGGTVDLTARLVAPLLAERLGQTVVVENRPGASGNLGIETVARAAADGHTVLHAPTALIVNRYTTVGALDPIREFDAVSMLNRNWLVLLVRADLPVADAAELIALARARPGQLTCGTAGGLPLFSHALFKAMAAVDVIDVPYKGIGPAIGDLAAGHIDLMFGVGSTSLPHVKSGRLRALAITAGQRRSGWAAGIPALAETLPGYVLTGWEGMLVPIGTPSAVIARLGQEAAGVLTDPMVRARLAEMALEPVGSTPAQFAAAIVEDSRRFEKLARLAGLKAD